VCYDYLEILEAKRRKCEDKIEKQRQSQDQVRFSNEWPSIELSSISTSSKRETCKDFRLANLPTNCVFCLDGSTTVQGFKISSSCRSPELIRHCMSAVGDLAAILENNLNNLSKV